MYDTVEFENNKNEYIKQTLWPAHCVQHTDGADFDPKLIVVDDKDRVTHVRKGTNPNVDSYSAFFDNSKANKTNLDDDLKKRNIKDLYLCGLATDVCVGK
jgi:nicotinamidase/pyrazinamidase